MESTKTLLRFNLILFVFILFGNLMSQTYIKVVPLDVDCKNVLPIFLDRYNNYIYFVCNSKKIVDFDLSKFNYSIHNININVSSLGYGEDGYLYIYERDKSNKYKAYIYKNGIVTYKKELSKIPYVIKDANGKLWKLSDNKIYKFVNNKFVEYFDGSKKIKDEIYEFDIDKNENIWIETDTYFAKYNGYNWNKYEIPNEYRDYEQYAAAIFEGWSCDSKGNIWIRVNGSNLLFEFDGKEWYEAILDLAEEEFYKNYLKKPVPEDREMEMLFIDVDKNDNLVFLVIYKKNNLYIVLYNEDGIKL